MDKIYIKNEDGKEVAYKTGWFNTEIKIGELHERSDGSKETRNFSGDNVTLERPDNGIFANPRERAGSVNGEEGTFSKDTVFDFEIENSPSFKPPRSKGNLENKVASAHATSYDPDYSDNYYRSSSAFTQIPSPRKINYILVGLAALVSGFLIYSMRTTELKEKERIYATQRTISNDNLEHVVGQEEQPIHLYGINFVYSYYESSNFCLMDGNLYKLDKNNRIFFKSLDHVLFVLHHFPVEEERKLKSEIVEKIDVQYITSLGHKSSRVVTNKVMYPKFFRDLDVDKDGKTTLYDLIQLQDFYRRGYTTLYDLIQLQDFYRKELGNSN